MCIFWHLPILYPPPPLSLETGMLMGKEISNDCLHLTPNARATTIKIVCNQPICKARGYNFRFFLLFILCFGKCKQYNNFLANILCIFLSCLLHVSTAIIWNSIVQLHFEKKKSKKKIREEQQF